MWATLVKHAGIAANIVELFHARFDPRHASAAQERDASRRRSPRASRRRWRRSRASTRTASCGTSSTPCSRRSAPISIRLDKDGQPKALIAIKFESGKLTDMPLPRPLYEIFVYSPRVEGVHHALRQGRARRHPLVRPAAGFPHRDSRPGEGAAGQERGDRAGRRQRRLRAEADAEKSDARAIHGRRHRDLQIVHRHAARHHRQYRRRRQDRAARQRRAPRGRRSLSRRRGRQGHRDLLRHRQRDSPSSTATGSATRSPRAARPATTTRRWASPRAARGNRVKRHFREMDIDIGKTPFTVVGVGDMSGDVFGNGMLREDTIKLVAAFDHRDIFIDPDPDPKRAFAERKRMFALPRSSWQDYDKIADLQGRRRLSARLEGNHAERRGAEADRRAGKGDAAAIDEGDPADAGRSAVLRRHRHLYPRVERDRRRGRRPRQRRDPHHRREGQAPR